MKKFTITLALLFGFIQMECFGRFAIVRKVYTFVDEISISDTSPFFTKVVKSALAWLFYVFPIVGMLAFFADFCVINLIEFWTGENIIDGSKDSNSDKKPASKVEKEEANSNKPALQPGKSIRFQSAATGMKLVVTKSQDGKELRFLSEYQGGKREIVAFQNEPGRLYVVEKSGELNPLEIDKDEFGSLRSLSIGEENIPLVQF